MPGQLATFCSDCSKGRGMRPCPGDSWTGKTFGNGCFLAAENVRDVLCNLSSSSLYTNLFNLFGYSVYYDPKLGLREEERIMGQIMSEVKKGLVKMVLYILPNNTLQRYASVKKNFVLKHGGKNCGFCIVLDSLLKLFKSYSYYHQFFSCSQYPMFPYEKSS